MQIRRRGNGLDGDRQTSKYKRVHKPLSWTLSESDLPLLELPLAFPSSAYPTPAPLPWLSSRASLRRLWDITLPVRTTPSHSLAFWACAGERARISVPLETRDFFL